MKILNFGSLNIDYIYKVDKIAIEGETISSNSLIKNSGGKGLNQSIAMARAKINVFHAGKIGSDGEFLLEILKKDKIDISNIFIDKEITNGHAIIQVDNKGNNCIILYSGANKNIKKQEIDTILNKFEKDDIVVLQNEINNNEYIIQKAKEKGMKVAINPSPIDDNIDKLQIEKCDFIFANEIETEYLCKTNNIDKIIKEIKQKFNNSLFILTLGCKGAYAIFQNEVYFQEVIKVKAVDTTAAGDTFCGYFIAEYVKSNDIKLALKIAANAAAITVTRSGAAQSIPYRDEIVLN